MSLTAAEVTELLNDGIRVSQENHKAERTARKGTDKRTGPFASDLGAECDLKLIRSFRDEPAQDMDTSGWLTVNMGHAFEAIVAKALGAVNVKHVEEVSFEIPVQPADPTLEVVTVNGRIDYLLLADDTLIELKAKGWSGYSYALDRGQFPSKAHKAQCLAYLHATQIGALRYSEYVLDDAEGEVEVPVIVPPQDRMVIVYTGFPPKWDDKNYDRPFAAFDVVYDEALALNHLQKAANLWRASRTDAPSETLGEKQNANYFPCATKDRRTGALKKWCSFYDVCHTSAQAGSQ